MFKITTLFRRPAGVPWFSESSPEAKKMNDDYTNAESVAKGFVSRQVKVSKDTNTVLLTVIWDGPLHSWSFHHNATEDQKKFLKTRAKYYHKNHIRMNVHRSKEK